MKEFSNHGLPSFYLSTFFFSFLNYQERDNFEQLNKELYFNNIIHSLVKIEQLQSVEDFKNIEPEVNYVFNKLIKKFNKAILDANYLDTSSSIAFKRFLYQKDSENERSIMDLLDKIMKSSLLQMTKKPKTRNAFLSYAATSKLIKLTIAAKLHSGETVDSVHIQFLCKNMDNSYLVRI